MKKCFIHVDLICAFIVTSPFYFFLLFASKPPKETKAREKRRKVDGDETEGEAEKPEDVKEKNEDVVESTQERLKVIGNKRGKKVEYSGVRSFSYYLSNKMNVFTSCFPLSLHWLIVIFVCY